MRRTVQILGLCIAVLQMSKDEGALDFSLPARQLHNKVRAFAGWPGTSATLWLEGALGAALAGWIRPFGITHHYGAGTGQHFSRVHHTC